jgi:hypothetical protein
MIDLSKKDHFGMTYDAYYNNQEQKQIAISISGGSFLLEYINKYLEQGYTYHDVIHKNSESVVILNMPGIK